MRSSHFPGLCCKQVGLSTFIKSFYGSIYLFKSSSERRILKVAQLVWKFPGPREFQVRGKEYREDLLKDSLYVRFGRCNHLNF